MGRRIVAVLVYTMALLSASVGALADQDCPDARTCPHFATFEGDWRWQLDWDGTRSVGFWINPVQPYVPEDEAIAAILAAFENWRGAAPGLHFEYLGTTTRPPVSGDGWNVIGFVDTYRHKGFHAAWAQVRADPKPWLIEADVAINALDYAWSWEPCAKEDGACAPYDVRDFWARWYVTRDVWPWPNGARTLFVRDIENVMTHEVGHMLGLDHPTLADSRELTMWPGSDNAHVYRHKTTLGLGDVLGARYLYPCACPNPQLYSP